MTRQFLVLPVAILQSDARYFISTDHLGAPKVFADQSGNASWHSDYTPFGTRVGETGSDQPLRSPFSGQYPDRETDFNYNYFRYYDPKTGRYTTSDPVGLKGGLNTYTYVLNNPINMIDPLGLETPTVSQMGSQPVNHLPTAGELPSQGTQMGMQCLADCLGTQINVTGAKEGAPHEPNGAHPKGKACDLGHKNNKNLERESVEGCFNQCRSIWGYGNFVWAYEGSKNYHFQTQPNAAGKSGFEPGIRNY